MTTLFIALLWVSAAWLTFGALASIAQIGKTRKPLEPGTAVLVVVVTAVIVGVLVTAALRITAVAS